MSNLAPLAAPGLAILPQYLTDKPLVVVLKGSPMSKTLTATTSDGLPLFRTEGKTFSISRRRAFLDANGQQLFEIRKEGMGVKHYYGELSEDGPRLFELETRTSVFHRPRTSVRFANQADPNRQMVELEYISPKMGDDGSLTWSGRQVAVVEKKRMSLSGEYQLSIAPGMDPALVVAIMAAMIDRAKAQSSSSAAAGGGAAAAAGG